MEESKTSSKKNDLPVELDPPFEAVETTAGPSVSNLIAAESLQPGEKLPDTGDGSNTYLKSGNLVNISGYVLGNVLYYLPDGSNFQIDDGRLNDPSAVRFLHDHPDIHVSRTEYSALRDQVIAAA